MRSVIVLAVSAWGAVLIFLKVALDLTVSGHMLRHHLSFPRGGEITVRQYILLALCSAHTVEALAQLLYEKSRLLEGGEVVALL
jgi:hypothetical protein